MLGTLMEYEKAIVIDADILLNDMRDGLYELFDMSRELYRRACLTQGEYSVQAQGFAKLMDAALAARTPILGFTSNYKLTDNGYVSKYYKPNKSRPAE